MHSRWLAPRALGLHMALLVVVPGCLYAGWWQATVALSGNTLSYIYAFEWPVFAILAIAMWWNLLHDDRKASAGAPVLGAAEAPKDEPGRSPARVRHREEESDELAAYNDYLATLAARDQPKTLRNPWRPPSRAGRR